ASTALTVAVTTAACSATPLPGEIAVIVAPPLTGSSGWARSGKDARLVAPKMTNAAMRILISMEVEDAHAVGQMRRASFIAPRILADGRRAPAGRQARRRMLEVKERDQSARCGNDVDRGVVGVASRTVVDRDHARFVQEARERHVTVGHGDEPARRIG